MAFNKLNVVIGANIESLQKELAKVEKSLQRFGRKMQQIGTDLTQTLTVPIAGLGAASLKAFSDIERLEKGLIALMGSSEAAKAEMIKLREVAKLPGLGFEEAIKGSVSLQAVGFSADKARETLLAFGKAVGIRWNAGRLQRSDLSACPNEQQGQDFSGRLQSTAKPYSYLRHPLARCLWHSKHCRNPETVA